MSSPLADPRSERRAALIAGLGYVIIILLGGFANFFILGRLSEPEDAAATVAGISDAQTLFRGGVALFVIVLIADVVVAWGLYVFLQRTSRELSLFVAWFRLVYVAIAAAALLTLLIAVELVDGSGYASGIETGQRDALVKMFLNAHAQGWGISLVFFGVHLLMLGVLIIRSDHAPTVLGVLLTIAGAGYVLGHLGPIVLPGHHDLYVLLVSVLALPGEFGLPIWLLWKGGRHRPATDQRQEAADMATTRDL